MGKKSCVAIAQPTKHKQTNMANTYNVQKFYFVLTLFQSITVARPGIKPQTPCPAS